MERQAKVRTCLWFNGRGREAAEFYVSLLPGSRVEQDFTSADEEPIVVEFTLAEAPMMILNGGPMYEQTEAASILVVTSDQAETDDLWDKLVAKGGEEGRCGWLKDRYGVSWQVIPKRFSELLSHEDDEAAGRAHEAMMAMKKIDIAELEAAFHGKA